MNEYEQLINTIDGIVNENKPHIYIVNEIRDRLEVFKNKQSIFKSIKQIVSDFNNLQGNEISSKSRKREIVESRQIAMYFYHKYTKLSLKSISLEFVYLDHVFDHSELADISIVCDSIAMHYGIDLQAEKEKKMYVNENRVD